MLPVDVMCSEWMCTLEAVSSTEYPVPGKTIPPPVDLLATESFVIPPPERQGAAEESRSSVLGTRYSQLAPALRLGLRYVCGLREEAGQALGRERMQAPFTSIHDLSQRVPRLGRAEPPLS